MSAKCLLIAVIVAAVGVYASASTKITSDSTFYDRKNGYAVFTGKVHVDDEQYQLHADKAYVFMEGTNELKRIVATGKIAVTNESRRAYGTKLTYFRDTGLIVLSGDESQLATIIDASKTNEQSVVGAKIRFWTASEQVEVLKATITAPTEGIGDHGLNPLK